MKKLSVSIQNSGTDYIYIYLYIYNIVYIYIWMYDEYVQTGMVSNQMTN